MANKVRSKNIQDLGMLNEVNLCSSCLKDVPSCDGNDFIYGNGIGNDNIASCSGYVPIKTRREFK